VAVAAPVGLALESILLAPLAAGLLWFIADAHPLAFQQSGANALLLSVAGPITAVPLILFAYGARRLSFTTLGPLQYLTPSVQFFLAMAFGESVTPLRLASFALIWIGLIVFTWDAVARERGRQRLAEA